MPENRTKAAVYGGLIVIAAAVALYVVLSSRSPAGPDEATRAAMERAEIHAQAAPTGPPPATLPVEQRPARGAVPK
ncbi:MAG: hypothetical protein WD749_10935 [Phycisphaerales bacterium]